MYGPGQRPDMAFNRFIEAVRSGKPITLYGDGRQTRDFTFVDDIVDGSLAAGRTERVDGAFNLGGGTPAPLTEVLRILGELAGPPRRDSVRGSPRPGTRGDLGGFHRAAGSFCSFSPEFPSPTVCAASGSGRPGSTWHAPPGLTLARAKNTSYLSRRM